MDVDEPPREGRGMSERPQHEVPTCTSGRLVGSWASEERASPASPTGPTTPCSPSPSGRPDKSRGHRGVLCGIPRTDNAPAPDSAPARPRAAQHCRIAVYYAEERAAHEVRRTLIRRSSSADFPLIGLPRTSRVGDSRKSQAHGRKGAEVSDTSAPLEVLYLENLSVS